MGLKHSVTIEELVLGLSQYVLLAVLLGLPAYARDVLELPLYADRILFVDLYLVLFAGILCYLWSRDRPRQQSPSGAVGLEPGRANSIFHGALLFCLIFLAGAIFHGAGGFMVPLQASVFSGGLAALTLLALHDKHHALLDKMNLFLTLIILWQSLVLAIGYAIPQPLELAAPRNLWAYAGVLAFSLNQHYARGKAQKFAFINALLLIFINGTKGALALLAVVLVLGWMRKISSSRPILTYALAGSFVASVVLAHVALYYYGMNALVIGSLAELEYWGSNNRAAVDDQVASSISRVFSVPYSLQAAMAQNALLGLGAVEAAKVTFWGYPVHNLFVSYIVIFGLSGLVFSLLYLLVCFKLAKASLPAFAIAAFVPVVANDLYPLLALCLLPLLTRPVAVGTRDPSDP